jgi:hypothetical protein
MKNILFAILIGSLLSACSYYQRYQQREEARESLDSLNQSINRSQRTNNRSGDQKTDSLLRKMGNSPKIKALVRTIPEIEAKSDTLIAFINRLQKNLEANATSDADLDVSTKLLAEGPDGRLLKKMLEDYKSDMDTLMKPYPLSSDIPIDIDPPTSGTDEKMTWEKAYFHKVPKVAAMAILSKFKSDVRHTEIMCIERLSKEELKAEE